MATGLGTSAGVITSCNAGIALAAWCAGLMVHRVCACEHINASELKVTLFWALVGGAGFWNKQQLHWSAEAAAIGVMIAGAWHAREKNIVGPAAIQPNAMIDIRGKVVIVTGASYGGIGYDTALAFAQNGAQVVLCLRNEKKAQLAQQAIIAETGNKDISYELLDLASLESVALCAKRLKARLPRVDILVNNAGLMTPERRETQDGLETNLQVNCLAPHLFCVMLLPSLRKSVLPSARVINVSSSVHKAYKAFGTIDAPKLNRDNGGTYGMFSAYSRSKFLLLVLSHELNKRLRGNQLDRSADKLLADLASKGLYTVTDTAGAKPVYVNSVMPGCIATAISQNMPWWAQLGHHYIVSILLKNCDQGARSTVFVATAKAFEGVGGEYVEHSQVAPGHKDADDQEMRQEIWQWAETALRTALTNIKA